MPPTEIIAPLHFHTLLKGHTYLIADFYATWCPPCKTIAPVYEALANAHSSAGTVAFVKVNVDAQKEVAAQYGIQAMPTFLVFREGSKVEEIKGADVRTLKRVVEGVVGEVGRSRKVEEGKKEGKVEVREERIGDEKTVLDWKE
ncbi:thioredoxin-domain-containing protein [Massarina eburnea CBS 473.64]|uniref:Thioredoxin-domain-containing protein n=1 Tax=Massarina eburnea CBS 473.64 TaxID=1395130 RepID=A0A6A6SDW3_9PLEO|nr:thioredoxin-domain-containing protein [Massarina eburnea CBS 473.64]